MLGASSCVLILPSFCLALDAFSLSPKERLLIIFALPRKKRAWAHELSVLLVSSLPLLVAHPVG